MKNLVIILITLLSISILACSQPCEEIKSIDPEYLFQDEVPDFETWQELTKWVSNNLYGTPDARGKDKWQTALQTWLRTRTFPNNSKIFHLGDCEDASNFLLYLLKKKFDIEGYCTKVSSKFDGGGHVIVYIEEHDAYLEPLNYKNYIIVDVNSKYNISEMIPYGEAMYMAEQGHYIKSDCDDPTFGDLF